MVRGNSIPQIEGLDRKQSAFYDLVMNVMGSRKEFLNRLIDPRRDVEGECGHPENIELKDYQRMFDRHGVAARAVSVMAKETWKVEPEVYEDEDPETITPFEEDWGNLSSTMGMMTDHFRGDCGSPVMEVLKRADILCGIGRYGVIVLGLDDGLPLSAPARSLDTNPAVTPRRLVSMRVFPEILAPVRSWDDDRTSVRYGMPNSYSVCFSDNGLAPGERPVYGPNGGGWGAFKGEDVHWSRIIHVVDNVMSSEVYGVPRCQPIFDELLDVRKVRGGSAEMYWRGAFPGLSIESHPSLGGEALFDETATKQMMEDYMNGLQRYIALLGMSVKSLAPQVVDPTPQVMVLIQSICINLGIPMRIFMGSERGELSSAQDSEEWADRVRARQKDQVNPRIIRPFVNHLIWLGCLRPPGEGGLFIDWPDASSRTDKDKAQIAFQKTQALVQYVKGEGWRIIPPLQFLTLMMGMSEKEASSVIQAAKDEGLFNLKSIQTSGRQDDYTNLGRGYGGQQGQK